MKPARTQLLLDGDRGIYLVLFSLMLTFILAFVALVVGIGYLTAGQARFQRAANLVSLAALERYQQAEFNAQGTPIPYATRAAEAVIRANDVLSRNQIPGFQGAYEAITTGDDGPGGTLKMGTWYREQAPQPAPECPGGNYPCFIEGPNQQGTANAVRLTLRNSSSNPFSLPFCRVLGNCEKQFDSSAYATLVQRCTAFVVDLSVSSFSDNFIVSGVAPPYSYSAVINPDFPEPPPNKCEGAGGAVGTTDNISLCALYDVNDPASHVDIARPFFRAEDISPLLSDINIYRGGRDFLTQTAEVLRCYPSSYLTGNALDRFWWCNLGRNGFYSQRGLGERGGIKHYRSDYMLRDYTVLVNGTWEQRSMLVDSYVDGTRIGRNFYEGPEPFTSFFHAFNSISRVLERQASPGDKATLRGFTGLVRAKFPHPDSMPEGSPQLTEKFGALAQITNLRNRGTINEFRDTIDEMVHPNHLDYGFFNLSSDDNSNPENNTNLVLALNDAVDLLQRECPGSSIRTIVLASDGIPSCSPSAPNLNDSLDPDDYVCDPGSFGSFMQAYNTLLASSGVLGKLVNKQIAVIGIQAGNHIDPNLRNRYTPDGRFMDTREAYSRGMTVWNLVDGWSLGPASALDCQPGGNPTQCHALALRYSGYPSSGFKFRYPLALMAALSLGSGGVYCPLMPICGDTVQPPRASAPNCSDCCSGEDCLGGALGCYENHDNDPSTPCQLKADYRPENSNTRCSFYYLSPGEQAAKCVGDFLLGNPYELVELEQ